jgi:hypothetical protein
MMRLLLFPAALLVAGAAGTAGEAPAIPAFIDETESAGISTVYSGDYEYMVGGGAASFDCSGDGLPDLFIAGGASPAGVYVNESAQGGALRFAKVESGAELEAVTGAYALDIDSDGVLDLALLRVGENVLMRGRGGCRFERANEAWGFDGGAAWTASFAATWEAGADWPTLAFGNYIDLAKTELPWGSCTDNWLHRPAEGGGFATPFPLTPSFCALSMLFTDWNASGTPSLRVSNDREYYEGGQEQMWHIEPGEAPRLFAEAEGWVRVRIWGMGIAAAELTGDVYPEYFLTSMADNRLQTLADPGKEGGPVPVYAEIALKRGVTAHRPYTGGETSPSTAWHAAFEDVNNDGRADLFVAKGNVDKMPDFAIRDPNNLLLQQADGTFVEAGDRAGVASVKVARGAALADFNADGFIDLVVVNRRDGAEVWRNSGATGGNWLSLTLKREGVNPDGVGSWIEVRTEAGLQRREVTVGGGHAGGHAGAWHFGLGEEASAEVRVIWPGGAATEWARIEANQMAVLGPNGVKAAE